MRAALVIIVAVLGLTSGVLLDTQQQFAAVGVPEAWTDLLRGVSGSIVFRIGQTGVVGGLGYLLIPADVRERINAAVTKN